MSRIFLIEDDEDLATGLLFTFEEEGYGAFCASTAKEARSLYTEPFDVVVLDVMLPDGSGYDLCRELRKRSDVPIIFLTSCDDEVNIVMGLDGGGDDYVTKPFQLKVLMSRIKAHLRRHSPSHPSLSQFPPAGNVQVDSLNSTARVGQDTLPLTVTEFRLLSMLVTHYGQIVTRQQFLTALWDNRGDFIDDNTLSVHIRHLREKLDAAGSTAAIGTVRGLGYRLEVRT
jgi:DNA-binding response OmpR family regulator